ncbi:MAG: DUF6174 domain-containing protein [Gemmatimonadota bacterium]
MTQRTCILALATAVGLSAACHVLGPGRGALEDLRDSRRRWENSALTDYSFVLQRACFCGMEAMGPVRITVEDGVRTSAIYVESGEPVGSMYEQHFPTMAGLFDQLEEMFARADVIEAEYHPTLGYPVEVQIDFITNAIDDELGLSIRDVQAAGTPG